MVLSSLFYPRSLSHFSGAVARITPREDFWLCRANRGAFDHPQPRHTPSDEADSLGTLRMVMGLSKCPE